MIVTRDNFPYVLINLQKKQVLGLDTETTGLFETDRLFSIIISCDTRDLYFNFNEYEGLDQNKLLPRSYLERMQELFADPDKTWFIQNAKFDMRMLSKEGLELEGEVVCTETLGRVEKNTHFKYSLDIQAARLLGVRKDKAVDEFIAKNKLFRKYPIPGKSTLYKEVWFDKVPFEIISTYGQKDGRIVYDLGRELTRRVGENQHLTAVARNEARLTKTTFRMERRGIHIDPEYTERILRVESALLETAKSTFRDLTGVKFTDSAKALVPIFDRHRIGYGRTPKGNASFKSDFIKYLDHPIPATICDIRRYEKRIGTYYSSFLFHSKKSEDGRTIHADIRQAGTETGRFSYRDPNLQNVPKEEKAGPGELTVRGCFVPRPGHCLVMIDYEQQEYRLMLDYAGQMDLIEAVMAGADVHQATADLVGIERQSAKTLNFAILYGSGIDTIAAMLKITPAEAYDLRRKFFAKLPYVQNFIGKVKGTAKNRGYVRNWLGRYCHCDDPKFAYKIPNHLIQGGCADVIKVAMNQIDDYLLEHRLKSGMVIQVHDEIVFEMALDELHHVRKFQDIMESVYPSRNGMILETSAEMSHKSWGKNDVEKFNAA